MSRENGHMSTTERAVEDDQEDSLEARVDVLEARQEWLDEHVVPKANQVDAAFDEIEEIKQTLAQLSAEVENIHSLDDAAASTPEKRAAALRQAMLNTYQARNGPVAWDYNDVKDALESRGHGTIHDPQAYDAMEDAANKPGFEEGEIVKEGDSVRGIKLVPDRLPDELAGSEASNEINRESDSHAGQSGGTSLDTDTNSV